MDSRINGKHQGISMIKCEPEWQCNDTVDLDMASGHLPGLDNRLGNYVKLNTGGDLLTASNNTVEERGMKCEEEMLEGISLNQNLNDSLLGHKVKMEQRNVFCKQEPAEVVNTATDDISATIDELAQGHDIKREEEILARVSIKQEAGNDIVDNDGVETEVPDASCELENVATYEESCKPDKIFTMRDKPDISIEQEISKDLTTSLSVKTRGTNKSKIRRVLTHSSPDDLNVNRELDCVSLLMLSSSLHRPCFVNMCDNNVLYNSQQHLGEMTKIIHRKRNPRKSKMSLALPKLMSHRPCNRRIHKSNTCNYSASHLSSRARYKRTHTGEKPYMCDKCHYVTAHAGHLLRHKRIHTGEKPYRCDKCPYATARADHLVTHKRTHSGETPYRCDKCPYATSRALCLVIHKRTHTGETSYRCDKCPYATAHACALVTHKRTHTGETPYRCDKCPYAAAQAGSILRHKRTHTGEKPYRCDKCPYVTARADTLVTHKRTHTGEKPYRCDKCPYTAAHAGNLVTHKRTHAGK